jgi:hypothetical protein
MNNTNAFPSRQVEFCREQAKANVPNPSMRREEGRSIRRFTDRLGCSRRLALKCRMPAPQFMGVPSRKLSVTIQVFPIWRAHEVTQCAVPALLFAFVFSRAPDLSETLEVLPDPVSLIESMRAIG